MQLGRLPLCQLSYSRPRREVYQAFFDDLAQEGTQPTTVDRYRSAGPRSGRVMGPYPPDSVVRVVSSDDPPNPVPDPGEPAEGGHFLFPSLVPGRYVIELVSDGAVRTRVSVEAAPGEEPFVTLVAPSP